MALHVHVQHNDFVFLAREGYYITNFKLMGNACIFVFIPCSFPGADDNTLFQKFERQQKNHAHYRSPQLKQQDPQFTILHYASEVTYSVKVLCTQLMWCSQKYTRRDPPFTLLTTLYLHHSLPLGLP